MYQLYIFFNFKIILDFIVIWTLFAEIEKQNLVQIRNICLFIVIQTLFAEIKSKI